MKKLLTGVLVFGLIGITAISFTAGANNIKLIEPNKTTGIPLMQTIAERQSMTNFAETDLAPQVLSDVLWAAYGMNKKGTRTIPTAMNKQEMKVYAIMKDGAYLYNGPKHRLEHITDKDLRPEYLDTQDYVRGAPLTLVYVGSDGDAMHAGSSYQNVGLYAASMGLVARVRGYINNAKGLGTELNIKSDEKVLISISIGNAK